MMNKHRYASPLLLLLLLPLLSPAAFAQKAPRDAADFYNRGLERQGQGDLDGAIEDYTKAIQLAPRMAQAYNNRANARLAKGDTAGALADFGKVIELNPQDFTAYANRGVIRLQKGQDALAERDFAEAIRLDPALKASLEKYLAEMRKRKAK